MSQTKPRKRKRVVADGGNDGNEEEFVGTSWIRLTLSNNVSAHKKERIVQFIEEEMKKNNTESSNTSATTIDDSPTTLLFSNSACIDRTGATIAMPVNVQSAHHWEAWQVPLYNLTVSSAAAPSTDDASISATSATPLPLQRTATTTTTTKYFNSFSTSSAISSAPEDHISRQARGRYHLHCDPTSTPFIPGQPLSASLTKALGLDKDKGNELTPPPWLERMKRYGWPPGYLKRLLDPTPKLEMFDQVDDDKETSKGDVPKKNMSFFPMYVWAPNHPDANQMFAHLPQPTPVLTPSSNVSASEDETESGLVEWPCPVLWEIEWNRQEARMDICREWCAARWLMAGKREMQRRCGVVYDDLICTK